MRVLRLTIPIILFAAFMVGCIVQADTYSDQNPFSAPDSLQSSDDGTVPTATQEPTATVEPTATATPKPPTATPSPTATNKYRGRGSSLD
ncbi:MAG: hypothetical protein OXI80_18935 [Caldilineaceae bacterium]|nr:hypothetical protein [Caldilineaceae bacterium]MDE0339756.1 hypothetical protein [Caldilineaceae bacterium]